MVDYEYYKQDIARYRKNFVDRIIDLNALIKVLERNGKISKGAKIEARIKSYDSFINNFNKGKSVSDCFGIRIIASGKDLQTIIDASSFFFDVIKEKEHYNPNTNYYSRHFIVLPKKDTKCILPFVEIQLCTPEQDKINRTGATAHDRYKLCPKGISEEVAIQYVQEEHKRIVTMDEKERNKYLPVYFRMVEGKCSEVSPEIAIMLMFPTIYDSCNMNKVAYIQSME